MKVLAISNAHALAHVSRLLEISKVLRQRGHEVLFAGHGKYLQVASWDDFATRELAYISVEQVVKAVRSQKLWELYPEVQLREYIAAELKLYNEFQPDLILLDNRPTARTSADIAGLKSAAVVNVHMSVYKRFPFFSLANMLGSESFPGVGLADRLGNIGECFFYDRLVMRGLNKIRKEKGLKSLYSYQHEEGDITLFADTPEFNPVRTLPPHGHYIGPLTWHNSLPAPSCLEQLRDDQPRVYMSLGSEGLEDLIEHLGILARQGIQVIVATGAAAIDKSVAVPEGVFLEEYINTDKLLPHCDLVCCHGGNGTLYQALSYGIPVVVVATHQEQAYGGKRIQRLGLGRTMMFKTVKKQGFEPIRRAIEEVLKKPEYRERTQLFSSHLRGYKSAELAATIVETSALPH